MKFKGFEEWIEIFRGGRQVDSTGREHDGGALIKKVLAAQFVEHRKARQALQQILEDVFEKCSAHRELVRNKQTTSIYDWVKQWQAHKHTQ